MKILHISKAYVVDSVRVITKSKGFREWRKSEGKNCSGAAGQWPYVKGTLNQFLEGRGFICQGEILKEDDRGVIYESSESDEDDEFLPHGKIVLSLKSDISIFDILKEYNPDLGYQQLEDIYVAEVG